MYIYICIYVHIHMYIYILYPLTLRMTPHFAVQTALIQRWILMLFSSGQNRVCGISVLEEISTAPVLVYLSPYHLT
jgi:hypothetical protein